MKPLENTRQPLLDLHRILLESQRKEYERVHGRTSPAEFLQALISDPDLGWLKPLTALVASLDAFLGDDDFYRHYKEALQRDPELLVAHGKLMRATASQ